MYFTHANLVWYMLEAIDLEGLTVETWQKAHPSQQPNALPHPPAFWLIQRTRTPLVRYFSSFRHNAQPK